MITHMIRGVDDKLVFIGSFAINPGRGPDLSSRFINSEHRVSVIAEHAQRVRDPSCFTHIAVDSRHCQHVDWSLRFLDDRRAVRVGGESWSVTVDRLDSDGDGDGVEQRRPTVVASLHPQLEGGRPAPVLDQRPPDPQLAADRVHDEAIVDVAADDVVDESSHALS